MEPMIQLEKPLLAGAMPVVWPTVLDLGRDECKRILRKLGRAYAGVVSALRAQGDLTRDKKDLLAELTKLLGISTERHRAEVRRAVNDERLATIACHMSGPNSSSEWSIEGRRLVPLMPRLVPQTAFTVTANAVATATANQNASLLLPAETGNKEVVVCYSYTSTTCTSTGATATSGAFGATVKSPRPPSPSSNVVVLPSGSTVYVKSVSCSDEDEKPRKRRRTNSSSASPVLLKEVTKVSPQLSKSIAMATGGSPKMSNIMQSIANSLPPHLSPVKITFTKPSVQNLELSSSVGRRMEVQAAASSGDVQSEDDQPGEMESEEDPLNWQSLVSHDVLTSLTPQEIKRQEVINELFYTERAHLRTLKVLDSVFCQRLTRDAVLPPEDVRHIFINLEEIVQLHVSITEQMTAIRRRSETSVIGQIADDLLGWFSGEEEETMKTAVGTFCSNQPSALELIKSRKKKDQRFYLFMREAESNRLCRRLQLKDIIPVEMQRVTKYPLLLDNIAKYTGGGEEKEKVKKAAECCKKILNHVNRAVQEAEDKQKLEEYQRRLDISSLKQSENPVILEMKNLDLTKRKMVHEGPLLWKVNKDKIELHAVLLEDILVLLQRQDERLILRFHGKNVASAADPKHIFSPVIKLNTVLVRPVATDNKSFFVLSMSDNGPQIYELMAQAVSDQRTWQCLITQCADAMKAGGVDRDLPAAHSDAEGDDIIKHEKTNNDTSEGSVHSSDTASSLPSMNPFDDLKSVDEEAGAPEADRQEDENEDDEVDEAELEAFLDGQLMDRLQEESHHDIQEENTSSLPSWKSDDALRTLAMLKKTLLNHLMSREESGTPGTPGTPGGPSGEGRTAAESQQGDAHAGRNGGFVVLDFGSDDDAGGDVGIDMTKLLSSSSQTGDTVGPNLSRRLMTHLRLLQADLQYLKEVELKYNQLMQPGCEVATAACDINDGIQ
ncbi:rho guanine nucleotide exchange factor 12-like [Brachionichthys hirsutus]|uniref:rho guanine nucleotide exchange factor 12-like n=1 Tax=Brachionichthys hirsutus TaxID=412623 RepID=UPI003604A248